LHAVLTPDWLKYSSARKSCQAESSVRRFGETGPNPEFEIHHQGTRNLFGFFYHQGTRTPGIEVESMRHVRAFHIISAYSAVRKAGESVFFLAVLTRI
jgi:hypothetical protein